MTAGPLAPPGARARDLMLASLAVSYPDDELAEALADPTLGAGPALAAMAAAAAPGPAALQRRYVDLFDRGNDRVSLYETEHGRMRGMSKGHDLADLAGFYHAFGVTLDERGHEMLDHLGVELEFYAVLLLKHALLVERGDAEGCEIVEAARRAFLADHLGRFVATIAAQPRVAADACYGPALAWCAELVDAECAELGVTPAPLDFFAVDREPDRVECGTTVRLPVVDQPGG